MFWMVKKSQTLVSEQFLPDSIQTHPHTERNGKRNRLFLISGPSGVGKTSVVRAVMTNEVVSFTTRDIRQGEHDGIDYNFITRGEFSTLYVSDGLVEHSEYSKNFYGIAKSELYGKLARGHAFAIVDVHGMEQLRAIYPHTVSVFIYCDAEEARRRMVKRGDSASQVERRMATFCDGMDNTSRYDYVFRNNEGRFHHTVCMLSHIVRSETWVGKYAV